MSDSEKENTQGVEYTRRLIQLQECWWKRVVDVQAPYRWNLKRLQLGFTLDLGCGIGRNLINLQGNGIGVDHNELSVRTAVARGVQAMTPDEFWKSEYAVKNRFDSLLLAHVAEHMQPDDVVTLLKEYLRVLKNQGRIVLITPQEAGFRSDPTHEQFMDFDALASVINRLQGEVVRQYSFPFPRFAGRFFKYNEFVVVGRLKGGEIG